MKLFRGHFNSYHIAVNSKLDKLNKSQWEDTKQLTKRRVELLRVLLAGAKQTAYYKQLFENTDVDAFEICDLKGVPILEKALLKENFSRLVNSSINEEELIVCSSGGSTGKPVKVLQSKNSKYMSAALKRRHFIWAGFDTGDIHIKLWGAPTDTKSALSGFKNIFRNYLGNIKWINAFSLSDNDMKKLYMYMLKNKDSIVLESYSNILFSFAQYIHRNNLAPIKVKSVISSAGTLYQYQRELIINTIGSNVYNRYGCREVGDIAQQCSEGKGLHINEERFIIEVINKNDEGVGDILVTDLISHAFPIIRYRIGDLGKLSNSVCKCGRKMTCFEFISGRDTDVLICPNGNRVSGNIFPHLFKDHEEIIEGQVVQQAIDMLDINIVTTKNLKLESELLLQIEKAVGSDVSIRIQYVKSIETTPTGKYKPVISNVM